MAELVGWSSLTPLLLEVVHVDHQNRVAMLVVVQRVAVLGRDDVVLHKAHVCKEGSTRQPQHRHHP